MAPGAKLGEHLSMSLSHAILGVLVDGARHGYAIQSALHEIAGTFWPINQGQVYATLARLERRELIRPREPAGPGDPRSDRRCYELSSAGRREWERWNNHPARTERNDALGFDDWAAHLAVCQRRGETSRLARVLELQRQRCHSLRQSYERKKRESLSVADRAALGILTAELQWLERATRELLDPADPGNPAPPDRPAPDARPASHESAAENS